MVGLAGGGGAMLRRLSWSEDAWFGRGLFDIFRLRVALELP